MLKLERLLQPKSIAVFGGRAATDVIEQSIKMGFAGEIWPVHPNKEEVAGLQVYRSVADLPYAPDAAWVGVNRHLTIEVVKALARRGAGGAVCFATGFLETEASDAGGERLQTELVAAAADMPIIGPNCFGLINYADGALLWPGDHGGIRLEKGSRGVAIITQSSNIAINMTRQKRGLPIAFVVTAGNQAQTGLSDLALGLIEDERVTSLGLHIEGFDSVTGFERLARRARELKKPIIAMKIGRSEQGRRATISHTASVAGSDAASGAFLKRLGIARVDSIPAFIEALKVLHVAGPLTGYRLSSMSWSGGDASLMADSAEGRLVHFPSLSDQHQARVQATLGPLVAVANPLDYNTHIIGKEPEMTETFTTMVSGGFDLNMLLVDFPRDDRCSNTDQWGQENLRAFETALEVNEARGAIVSSLPENLSEGRSAELIDKGIIPLHGISEALDAAQAAAFIGEIWRRPEARPIAPNFVKASAGKRVTLDESQAKARLNQARLPVPEGQCAVDAVQAVARSRALGFPVALKALGVAHKSEVGAVRLSLKDAEAVSNAARDLESFGTGLYVERMVSNSVAELIVGFNRDPMFGAVMTLGTGGVMVELLRDSVTLLLPATRNEIEAAIRGLKLFPLLDGFRGRPRADIQAAIDVIAGVAEFVLDDEGEIDELDINPLIVCAQGEGAWIADALLVHNENLGVDRNG